MADQLSEIRERCEAAATWRWVIAHAREDIPYLLSEIEKLQKTVQFYGEQVDENHQPATNYQLLIARLDGKPTNHGDCRVAAKLDELQAVVDKLAKATMELIEAIEIDPKDLPFHEYMVVMADAKRRAREAAKEAKP